MNDSTEGLGAERDQAELDQAEAMRQLQHELATAPPVEVVAQAVAHLATLAYVRLGVPPQENQRYQDLEAARVLIDALGGMLGAVEGRLGPGAEELYQALAALRMTYASVSGQQAGPPPGQGPEPPRPAEEPPRRPSGLWIPGQD
jgi:Domain of unknown function (DUF1844)